MKSPPQMIGAVDIGTNSAHLVVAEIDACKNFRVLDSDKINLRLGAALDANSHLTPAAIQKTTNALIQMRDICYGYTETLRVVATHAVREAKNCDQVIETLFKETSLRVEIIDGLEEARLIYLGVRHSLPAPEQKVLCLDIGGGSTEIILGKNEAYHYLTSLKLGAVILTEKFFSQGGFPQAQIKKLSDFIKLRLAPLHHELDHMQHDMAVFTSGTAKAFVNLYSRKFVGEKLKDANGYRVPGEAVFSMVDKLAQLGSSEAIEKFTGLSPARSSIILTGGLILAEITHLLGVSEWVYSDFALREGLVIDTYRRMLGKQTKVPQEQNFRWSGVTSLGRRMQIEEEQATEVEKITQQAFDLIWPALDFDAKARASQPWEELLQCAAHLHEIGKVIAHPKFHLHSEYILQHNRLLGFTQDERKIIGLIIRYHRKGLKTKEDDALFSFNPQTRRIILALASILRFAASVNRVREKRVQAIKMKQGDKSKTLQISLTPGEKGNLNIELVKLNDDRAIFEKTWDHKVEFSQD